MQSSVSTAHLKSSCLSAVCAANMSHMFTKNVAAGWADCCHHHGIPVAPWRQCSRRQTYTQTPLHPSAGQSGAAPGCCQVAGTSHWRRVCFSHRQQSFPAMGCLTPMGGRYCLTVVLCSACITAHHLAAWQQVLLNIGWGPNSGAECMHACMIDHMLHTFRYRLQLRDINIVQMLVVILGPLPSLLSISNMGGRVSNGQQDVTDCHC